ncbi:MAG: ImmA/IrrE family metallo-endopeptidase [Candidatus Saccharimonadales bacterium]
MTTDTVAEKAQDVLKKNNITSPFVNVFEIAEREGLKIEYRVFPNGNSDISGFLIAEDKTIYLNVENSPERQAYTVAHELGHYLLGHEPDKYGVLRRANDYENASKSQEEKDADRFAANLLMPEKMIRDELKRHPFLKDAPQILASKFGVSVSAMKYRLINLGFMEKYYG